MEMMMIGSTTNGSGGRGRRSRDTSPDRARVFMAPKMKTLLKVQVIYYLSRNGQLEHPHFMEVSHLSNQHLRLKDVMDKLSLLRGRAMVSLYSWSCKRTYKNGYVWNDLGENDVIYPADGVEYILKGSEIIEPCSEHFQQLQLTTAKRSPKPSLSPLSSSTKFKNIHHLHPEAEEQDQIDRDNGDYQEEEEEEEEEEEAEIVEDKGPSRCSRGVSTEELDQANKIHGTQQQSELNLDGGEVIDVSPNSSSSSENKSSDDKKKRNSSLKSSIAAEDDNNDKNHLQVTRTPSSVLLQIIACGATTMPGRGRTGVMNPSLPSSSLSNDRRISSVGNSGRKSLYKEVLSRLVNSRTATEDGDDEDVIKYMSENPRFGNLQLEDKAYFSGSIVESMTTENRDAAVASVPSLKRSSSYTEERRSSKCVIGEEEDLEEQEKIKERSVRGKCIPGRKRSVLKLQKQQLQHQHQQSKERQKEDILLSRTRL